MSRVVWVVEGFDGDVWHVRSAHMQRAWADETVRHCRAYGEKVRVVVYVPRKKPKTRRKAK